MVTVTSKAMSVQPKLPSRQLPSISTMSLSTKKVTLNSKNINKHQGQRRVSKANNPETKEEQCNNKEEVLPVINKQPEDNEEGKPSEKETMPEGLPIIKSILLSTKVIHQTNELPQ